MRAPSPKRRQELLEKQESLLAQVRALEAQLGAGERQLALERARVEYLPFVRLMMPDADDPLNVARSRYVSHRVHKVIATAFEEVEAGRMLRLIINVPPRIGKTTLCSKNGPPWLLGRNPSRHIAFGTYNEDFAGDIGSEVRNLLESPEYREVFPQVRVSRDTRSKSHIKLTTGGQIVFVGRGGALTGRGADVLIIDDPIKDRAEADSPTIREQLWTWFTQVAMTRLMSVSGAVVIIQTRWHEDDLVGRLTDPQNPHFNPEQAKLWKIINIPAIVGEEWGIPAYEDPLKREENVPLWPERFSVDFLRQMRQLDSRGFSALYQGRPAPEDGEFFKKEYLRTYKANELPPLKQLRVYSTSDHAVSTAQNRDATVLLNGGVDKDNNLWIFPQAWWRRAQTDAVAEAMLQFMAQFRPLMWWAERGHISMSIGPFLRKRMQEEGVYVAIDEITPVKDKFTRAQAIQGRMAMGKVLFPSFAPWWPAARSELLKFGGGGTHDDFVDALALFGLGLMKQVGARVEAPKVLVPKEGTFAHLKWQSRRDDRVRRAERTAQEFG